MNKSITELKAIAYDEFMALSEIGDVNIKIAALVLSAVYHGEISIQNNRIAKEESE